MTEPTTIAAYLDAIRKAGDIDIKPCSLVSDQFKPIPPHKVGITHLLGRSQFLLADATGLGKTPQAVVAWAYAREKDPQTRLLALVSKSSYFQFAAEVERFVPSATVEVLGWHRHHGKKRLLDPSERQAQYDRFAANQTSCLVCTYHTLALDFRVATGDPYRAHVWIFPEAWQPNVVIFDECHILRSDKQTLIYPMARTLAKQARAVWGLSATPLSTRLTDLYYLYSILRPGLLGSRAEFDETYLQRHLKTIYVKGGKRKVWEVTGTKNLDKLAALIKPYYLKRAPEVIGEHMPDIVVQPKQVEMDPKQTALYQRVCAQVFPFVRKAEGMTSEKRQAIEQEALDNPETDLLRIDGTKISTPAVAMAYAQMALDCPEVLGQPKVPSAKYDQLLDWLENDLAGEKVLVYTRYRQVAEVYHRKLQEAGLDVGLISGTLSAVKREQVRTLFQDTPSPGILILTSAGKESLNLQAARVIVFLDLPWSWSEFIQVVGRARRYGSAHRSVSLLLLGASPDTASGATSLDDTTLQTLQGRAILVQGTFGLTLAEAELTTVSFTDDIFQQAQTGV